jgi:tetratricopeptide (TPR) repeat protein
MATEAELRTQLAAITARGDRKSEVTIRFELARALRQRGALSESRDEFLRVAELLRAAGAGKNLSATLNNLGLVCIALNDRDGAGRAFNEAIDLSSRVGDFDAVRRTLGNFAAAVSDAGDFEAARMLHEQALEIASKSNDRAGMARSLSNLAWTDLRLGSERAAVTASKAVELATGVIDPRVLATVTHTHALVCLRERVYDLAISEADWCRRTFSYLGEHDWVSLAGSTAVIAAAARGDWSSAVSALSTALATMPTAQLRRGLAQRCVGLASVAAVAGEPAVAVELCELAIVVADALGDAPLRDAAQAQRDQRAAASPGGAEVLRSCRAMLQPSGQPVNLLAVPWLQRRYGERPPLPAPVTRGRDLIVGPLTLIDLTSEGHGWSLFQNLTALLGTETNYDAEERIRAIIEQNDPLLAKALDYDTEGDNVSISAKSRDDILGVAAWVLSIE